MLILRAEIIRNSKNQTKITYLQHTTELNGDSSNKIKRISIPLHTECIQQKTIIKYLYDREVVKKLNMDTKKMKTQLKRERFNRATCNVAAGQLNMNT